MKLSQLADIVGGTLHGQDAEISGQVQYDSRAVQPGDFFLALIGEKADGHDFVADAMDRGAVGALTTRPVGARCVVVKDVVEALQMWARHHREQLSDLVVVGITGSQGKTTTKDLTAQLLERLGATVSSVGSYNNDLGAPLTLLRCTPSTKYCVLEMGARHLGDIRRLAQMAHLNIGVVLLVGTAHLSEFGSREGIAQTKGEIVEDLAKTGTAILGTYDEYTPRMQSRTKANVLLFGDEGSVRALNVSTIAGRSQFTLDIDGHSSPVSLQIPGEHHVANALAAASVAYTCGMGVADIAAGLSAATARSKWRMEFVERGDGLLIINDAYNASPESMKAALRTLVEVARERGGRSWAVLGEMRELGESATSEHDAIGRLAVRLDVSRLIAVGSGARAIHLGAAHEGSWGEESIFVESIDQALAALTVAPPDVVLVKASRAIGLELLVTRLLEAK